MKILLLTGSIFRGAYSLTSKGPIKKIEARLKIETNSLIGCLIVLQFGKDKYVGLDSLEKKAIIERIEEIADQFLEKGSPILIFGTGLNSVEKTMSLNSEPNKHNLIYITQGNSCLGDDSMEGEGISAFNQRTLKRLGLEAFPIQEMKGSTIKKRKRKTRPNTSYLGLNGTLQSTNRKRKGIIMLDGL